MVQGNVDSIEEAYTLHRDVPGGSGARERAHLLDGNEILNTQRFIGGKRHWGSMATVRIGGVLVSFCATLFAQQAAAPPAFEVASIKPSLEPPGRVVGIFESKGRISAKNVTLKRCVRGAYDLPEPQIIGGPKWVDQDRGCSGFLIVILRSISSWITGNKNRLNRLNQADWVYTCL